MLTGDSETTARTFSAALGIDDFIAEVLPDQKAKIVKRFQTEGRKVAMAGNGINDAPSLAQAEVGIAMVAGTHVALESGEVTLVKGDLRGIVRAIRLSRGNEEHQTESFLCLSLQRRGNTRLCRSSISVFWNPAQPDDCRGGNEFQLGVSYRKLATRETSFYLESDSSASEARRCYR